jgi:hypothetical protein
VPCGSHFIAYFKRQYDQYENVIRWMFMCAPHNINDKAPHFDLYNVDDNIATWFINSSNKSKTMWIFQTMIKFWILKYPLNYEYHVNNGKLC